MANHLTDLRNFMDAVDTRFTPSYDAYEVSEPEEFDEVVVQPDYDSLIEQLELLRFKLETHRQMTGSYDYALGYEEACMKVVEMLNTILYSCKG